MRFHHRCSDIVALWMDFDTCMIVQITYLKGKICAAIKIHDTGES